jgi:hypothetical protein
LHVPAGWAYTCNQEVAHDGNHRRREGAGVRGKVTHPGYMNAIEQHLAKAGDLWPATPR